MTNQQQRATAIACDPQHYTDAERYVASRIRDKQRLTAHMGRVARRIGLSAANVSPPNQVEFACHECGHLWKRYRVPREVSCPRCHGSDVEVGR